jgi:PhnB protein
MPLEPYLFFEGHCDEALDFYKKALGANVTMLMRYSESPTPPPPGKLPPGSDQKVMHAVVRIGDSTLLASDGFCSGKPGFGGFSLSLSVSGEAEARRAFDALADGGQVRMPLSKTFFSPCFGMLTDRFGVSWMIGVRL